MMSPTSPGPADMNGDTIDRQIVAGQAKSNALEVLAGLFIDLSRGYPSAHTPKCNHTPTVSEDPTFLHARSPSV